MPPTDRFVCRFAAEPPQEPAPYGRWADRLKEEFTAALLVVETDGEDLGEPGELRYFPDRTWAGRTYVPVTSRTSTGFDLFGYVAFAPADPDAGVDEPTDFTAWADFTDETAEENPDWKLDLCEEVIGGWRGEMGKRAAMTLVWGVPLVGGGAVVTAELAGLAVDQCALVGDRFTLIAPDAYRGDYLDVLLWSSKGDELARESLYDDDGED